MTIEIFLDSLVLSISTASFMLDAVVVVAEVGVIMAMIVVAAGFLVVVVFKMNVVSGSG